MDAVEKEQEHDGVFHFSEHLGPVHATRVNAMALSGLDLPSR